MKAPNLHGPWGIRPGWADENGFEIYPTYGGQKPKIGVFSALAEIPDGGNAETYAKALKAVPDLIEALILAQESLARFVSDEGSGQCDFDVLDTVTAALLKAGCTDD